MSGISANDAYRNLTGRLTALRKRQVAARSLYGAALALCCALSCFFVLLILETALYLSPSVKVAVEGAAALAVAFLAAMYCIRPFFNPPLPEDVALQVEHAFGGLQQRLISALQLRSPHKDVNYSSPMVDAAVIQADEVLAKLNLDPLVPRSRPQRAAALCGALGLVILVAFAILPGPLTAAAGRLATPATAYVRPPATFISLHPGSAEIIAGEALAITAALSGLVPARAHILLREDDAWTPLELAVRNGRVAHRIPAVTRSFHYRLRANDAITPVYEVTARPRPMAVRIRHDNRYPAYTGLEEVRDVEGGDIVAIAGTSTALRVRSSLPLSAAEIVFDDSMASMAQVEGRIASFNLTVGQNRRYTIALRDEDDVASANPVEYRVVALQDHPPEIRLLRPGKDTELGEDMRVPLFVEARDDLGVSRIEIRYRLNDEEAEDALSFPLDNPGAGELTQTHVWDLSGLDLLPGDRVVFRLRAYDGNTVSGPGTTETPAFTIRFPSLLEIHRQARQAHEEGLERMTAISEEGEAVRERLEEIAQRLLTERQMQWQHGKELETAIDDQAAASEKLDEVSGKLEETLDRLEQSGLLGDETLRKLNQIQELLSEIESPRLKEAMAELRDAMQRVDSEAVKEALNAFRGEQEGFQKSLERTIALLRQLRAEQALEALAQTLEALSREQRRVVDNFGDQRVSSSLAGQQDAIARRTDALEDELAETAGKMGEFPEAAGELGRLADRFEAQRIPGRMRAVSRHLSDGAAGLARTHGARITGDLERFAKELQAARQAFVNRQKEAMIRRLNQMTHNLLGLSAAQERTARRAGDLSRESDPAPLAVEQARILAGATRLANHLMEAAHRTYFVTPETGAALGRALNMVRETAGHIQAGAGYRAADAGKDAMGGLNEVAMALRRAIRDISAAGSSVGLEEMLQRMQELADRQSGLNERSEATLGSPRQSPGDQGLRMSLAQMAARQRAIQQAVREIRRKMGNRRRALLGDLDHIASEMETVTQEMTSRRAGNRTLERQRRILSRLLDAQRSIRERGRSSERRAGRGADLAYRGPGSLPPNLGEADNPLRRRLRDALDAGFAAEYRRLIRSYFETLMQDALKREDSR
ncbi:MAG: hypothetical protein OXU79_19250 [Gemmatimonadota bacterium]|nr:hypothetical protein [Gemmatimonadota bacterium]